MKDCTITAYILFASIPTAILALIILRSLFVADTHFLVLKYIEKATQGLPDYLRDSQLESYRQNMMTWKTTFDLTKWRMVDFYPDYKNGD